MFEEADINKDGALDRDEFARVINTPSELEQWCTTLPLPKLLAACLEPALASTSAAAPGREAVRRVADLPPQAIQEAVADFSAAMGRLLPERVAGLRECFSEQDRLAAAGSNGSGVKFQTFPMNVGTAENFHKGLADRVGACSAAPPRGPVPAADAAARARAAGEPHPNLQVGMEKEHCELPGHNRPFKTNNYNISTTAEKEWGIVTGKIECPEADMKDTKGKTVRVIKRPEDLVRHPLAVKAKLLVFEVLALVSCAASRAVRAAPVSG
jgi:hypothetical protein